MPKSYRIVDARGYFLSRDYDRGVWVWTKTECHTHYFMTKSEADRVARCLPPLCEASVE